MFDNRLHAYLRAHAGLQAHRVGPFLASFDDADAGLFRNYAIPGDGAEPAPELLTALIEMFHQRSRTPRLEYLPGICPACRWIIGNQVAPEMLPVLPVLSL